LGHEPIRAELYGLEQLAAQARALAAASRVGPHAASATLLRCLRRALDRELNQNCQRIAHAARAGTPLSPDAEWLLDNSYLVRGALSELSQDLRRGACRGLPGLADGPLAGHPRAYAVALALVAHTDSSLSEAHVSRFVQAYQEVAPLTSGELWAVPTLLRLALLENLRRLSVQTLRAWDERARAERWLAPRLSGEGEVAPLPLPPGHADDAFLVRVQALLRDQGPRAAAALEQFGADLVARGVHDEEVLRREHQRQAVNQVSVGNCVTSLRLLSALDWNVFFETTSLVEAVLRNDPAGAYPRQDFPTRDLYRRAVERFARGSRYTELEVAGRALALAQRGAGPPGGADGSPRNHVGYSLVGPGLPELKAQLGYRPGPGERLLEAALRHP
jgi:cyclic beta-1,2-glucan synthetase